METVNIGWQEYEIMNGSQKAAEICKNGMCRIYQEKMLPYNLYLEILNSSGASQTTTDRERARIALSYSSGLCICGCVASGQTDDNTKQIYDCG